VSMPFELDSFEPGTPAAKGVVPLGAPEIRGNEWKYIQECLETNWISSAGPFVDRFESMMSDYVGCGFGVATNSGTAALHIALLVAGVQQNDEVLVSTLTFIAPANAVRYIGAWPVFIDADPLYWQMDTNKLADFIKQKCQWQRGQLINATTSRRIKAILPVHILGHPCDMDPILQLAQEYGLAVIEDATESLGATYKQRMVGHLGDVACFSFNGNKIISSGSGGMLVTDNEGWAQRARYLTTQAKDDPVEYVHSEIGYNYRLTNLQAALGCAQMEMLNEFLAIKQRIAQTYTEGLSGVPGISTMQVAPGSTSTSWLNTVLVDEAGYGMSSRSLLRRLEAHNIQCRPLWQPLHLSPAHSDAYDHDCTVAEVLVRDALSLPSSVGLDEAEQGRVIDCIASSPAQV